MDHVNVAERQPKIAKQIYNYFIIVFSIKYIIYCIKLEQKSCRFCSTDFPYFQ